MSPPRAVILSTRNGRLALRAPFSAHAHIFECHRYVLSAGKMFLRFRFTSPAASPSGFIHSARRAVKDPIESVDNRDDRPSILVRCRGVVRCRGATGVRACASQPGQGLLHDPLPPTRARAVRRPSLSQHLSLRHSCLPLLNIYSTREITLVLENA